MAAPTITSLVAKTLDAIGTVHSKQDTGIVTDTMTLANCEIIQTLRHEFTLNSTTTLGQVLLSIASASPKTTFSRVVFFTSDKHAQLRFTTAGGTAASLGSEVSAGGFYLASIDTDSTKIYVKNLTPASTATITLVIHQVSWV
jgi:hypothetical protein